MYDSPPSRAACLSVDCSLYNLPRSYSHDVLPKVSPSSTEADGELYVFNTPSGTSSVEPQMRHVSISYDIPPTPGNTYQIPRTFPEGTLGQTSKLDTIPDIPPPRPPKPHPAHDRSPVDTCSITRTASDTDSSYCIPTAGLPPSRSNTISTVDLNKLRKGQHLLASAGLEVNGRKSLSLFFFFNIFSCSFCFVLCFFPQDVLFVLLIYFLIFFAALCGRWDLSSPTRGWTCDPGTGSREP